MLKINTYLQYSDNLLIKIDELLNRNDYSGKLSTTFNQYSIEIIYNEEMLKDFQIITIEPWVTYLLLMKNYFSNDFAIVTDLLKPITYSFTKGENNMLIYQIYNKLNDEILDIHLPEKEFILSLFENLIKYLECMYQCKPKYYRYWIKRYNLALYSVAKEIEEKYLQTINIENLIHR